MIVAMGDVYEKLGLFQAAKKCFWRGYCVGDMEGGALVALARCFDRAGEVAEAATAHTQYIKHCERNGVRQVLLTPSPPPTFETEVICSCQR